MPAVMDGGVDAAGLKAARAAQLEVLAPAR
jgi:hypothetical protein